MRIVKLISVLFALTVPATAQTTWARVPGITAQVAHATVWDSVRQRVVLVSGTPTPGSTPRGPTETWEWDGSAWRQRATPTAPPARQNFALAYDAGRQRVLLFGGLVGPTEQRDTWEWDGLAWTQRFPATRPPARTSRAMAYDTARGRVVLFGGLADGGTINSELADTWEWDGADWTLRQPAQSPPALRGHHLTYDAARQRVVLFGGVARRTPSNATWEWDGTTWLQRQPANRPAARSEHWLGYDAQRQRVVLFGGSRYPTYFDDTWEWDGQDWTQSTPASRPQGRSAHAMAYDARRGELVLFGGQVASVVSAPTATWEWDGLRWRAGGRLSPPSKSGGCMTYDAARNRVVLYGNDIWEWDGSSWSQPPAGVAPPPRVAAAIAYQHSRARSVLFGGGLSHADTWEWDGTAWFARNPATRPPGRIYPAMAHDRSRGRVVLFGGRDDYSWQDFGDTWEWDGTNWLQQQPPQAPSPRAEHAMVYDPSSRSVLLYGGWGSGSQETWSWDGARWTQLPTATLPTITSTPVLTYDAARQRVVLTGDGAGTWEWVGNDWVLRGPGSGASLWNGLAYHAGSGRSVALSFPGDTWQYFTTRPASAVPFGQGCAGSRGVPALAASSLPWLGAPFALRLNFINAPAVLWLGTSNTMWLGAPLPLDLTAAGMPGCSLLVAPDMTLAVPVVQGAGLWAVIPTNPSLVGGVLYAQGAAADPSANAAGVVLSNGVTARIGAK